MICIPLLAPDSRTALRRLRVYAAQADLVELRLDGIRRTDLRTLLAAAPNRTLVTNRRQEEGGFARQTEDARLARLCEAAAGGADLVDVELASGAAAVRSVGREMASRGRGEGLIVSHHDFAGTPPTVELIEIYRACAALGAGMVKVVTRARTVEDNLRVLELLRVAQDEGRRITAFCMGAAGRVSRVLAPLLGSCISYVAFRRGRESAAGQLTLAETKLLQRILA